MDIHEKKFLEANLAFLISEKKHYENQIYIMSSRLNDKAWKCEHNYLVYELGTAQKKLKFTKYLIRLLKDDIQKKDKFNLFSYEPEQLKF